MKRLQRTVRRQYFVTCWFVLCVAWISPIQWGLAASVQAAENPYHADVFVRGALIHYQRKNNDHGGWALHLWNFDPTTGSLMIPARTTAVLQEIQ